MTGPQLLFWIFAAGTCGGAVAVAVSQNVVRMAVWLIVSLGSAAGLFFLGSADFVAATQLLVYVGGTVVLLIFGVMLTASGPYVQIKASPGEGVLSAGIGVLFLAMIFSTVLAVDWNRVRLSQAGLATRTAEQLEAARQANDSEETKELIDRSYVLVDGSSPPVYRLRDGRITSSEATQVATLWDAQRSIGAVDLSAKGSTLRPLGLSFIGARPDRDLGKPEGPLSPGYLLPFEIVSVHLLVVLIGAAYLARAKRRAVTVAVEKTPI